MQIRSGFPHPIKLARHTAHSAANRKACSQSPFFASVSESASCCRSESSSSNSGSFSSGNDAVAATPSHAASGNGASETRAGGIVLACSFLCLFPTEHRREEQLGRINFDKLFAGVYERGGKKKNENKLRCLLHYFDRVCNSMPQGTVSFERKVLPKEAINDAIWGSSGAPLCPITVLQEGCIEDNGRDCLQVDFANRLLGGGALGGGCVQVRASFISAILSLSLPSPPFLSILFRRIVASRFRLKLLQSFVSLLHISWTLNCGFRVWTETSTIFCCFSSTSAGL